MSEAFSRKGYNISNARKLQFCKQPFEIIQGQIAFKNTVQCINKQTQLYSCCTMGNKKIWDHGFILCLKLLLIMKKHLFDV